MRISDWSSDVCSSDLHRQLEHAVVATLLLRGSEFDGDAFQRSIVLTTMQREANRADRVAIDGFRIHHPALGQDEFGLLGNRSEERRLGTECVRTFRSRWSPDH